VLFAVPLAFRVHDMLGIAIALFSVLVLAIFLFVMRR
jgi:hypothetical protein